MNTKEILNAFPRPEGKILRNIDKEACEHAVEQIILGGRKITREIIDLILEPGNGDDIRPRHAIHATAIRVGGTGKEKREILLPQHSQVLLKKTALRLLKDSSFANYRFVEEPSRQGLLLIF
jgi:(2Fe-2S) ferredoxin